MDGNHPGRGLAPERLQAVLSYIEQHSGETICVRDLAAMAKLSPFHFARLFKTAVGVPPYGYVTRMRMERAKSLLRDTDIALGMVATRVGFRTQAHFTGVFHKHVGTTPRVFRMSAQAQLPASASTAMKH